MQFLINKGFSEKTINELKEKYDESIIDCILLDRYNVEKMIDYFNSIGIKNIEALMLYKIELFSKRYEDIKKVFENYGVLRIVKLLNDDIINIDLL